MEQTTLTVRSLTAAARADDDERERQLTTRPPFYDIISRARVVIIIRLHATRDGRNRWIIGGETGACAGCGGGGGAAGDDRSRSRAIRRALPAVVPARRGAPARHTAACPGLRRPETTILEPELRNENPKVISVWTMPTTDRERQSQARRQAGGGALGAYVYGFKVGGVA